MASRRGMPRFRPGQWVTWVDPDENNLMKPHVGLIEGIEYHDGARVYFIKETEDLFQLVLEEELSPIRQGD
jgi:hypothetical protein